MVAKPSTLLTDFIRREFTPRYLEDRKLSTKKVYDSVARRLSRVLGRSSVVSDLTPDNFAAFNDYIATKNNQSYQNSAMYRGAFRRVWQLAFNMGLAQDPPTRKQYFNEQWRAVPLPEISKGEKPTTLRQMLTLYCSHRLRGHKSGNERQYWINIAHLQKFLGREPLLTDLDDELISTFLHWILETGRKPATANKARNHILALWRFAARKRYAETFPDVPRLTEPARVPKAWSESELAKLFAALEQEPGKIAGIPSNRWWVALHHVLWWSAERIGAVMRLKWSDVDLESGWLIVPAEVRKFQTSDKATQLPEVAADALRAIRAPEHELLFPWPYDHTTLYNRYGKILQRAGLPHDRKSKFHRMRKSAASHFEAAGGNATELLGHTSRRVTLAYLSPAIVKPQQTAAMLFSPSEGLSNQGGAS